MPKLSPRFVLAVLLLLAGCRTATVPASVIDSRMAACVPPSTTLLAGVDLDRLRASPLSSKLPPAVTALLDPVRDAHSLLLASDGRNLLSIARGPFAHPPAGATQLASDLVISGTPDFLAAAQIQHKAGTPGAPDLTAYAATVARGAELWIAARGGVMLPLTGNAANLNRLLRDCESAALTVKLDSTLQLSFTALGRTADAARKVENTLRATITLTAAGEARRPDLVALLHSIQLTRDDRTVRASVSAAPEVAQKLFE